MDINLGMEKSIPFFIIMTKYMELIGKGILFIICLFIY